MVSEPDLCPVAVAWWRRAASRSVPLPSRDRNEFQLPAEERRLRCTRQGQVVQVHVPGGMALEDLDRSPLLFVAACPSPEQKAASRELFVDLPRPATVDQAHQPDAAGPRDATGHRRGGKNRNQATPLATTAPIATRLST